MADSADVRSIAAVRDWHAALTGYGESLHEAAAGVQLEIRRGFEWLQDQLDLWRTAVREGEQDVVQAKAELTARKFPDWSGREPDTTVQERNLRRAKARLEHAEGQVERVRGWLARLPKVIEELYDGPARRLVNFVEAELPVALAQLGRRAAALEGYAGLRPDYAPAPSPSSLLNPPPPPAPGVNPPGPPHPESP